jgi:hypothetical protein
MVSLEASGIKYFNVVDGGGGNKFGKSCSNRFDFG